MTSLRKNIFSDHLLSVLKTTDRKNDLFNNLLLMDNLKQEIAKISKQISGNLLNENTKIGNLYKNITDDRQKRQKIIENDDDDELLESFLGELIQEVRDDITQNTQWKKQSSTTEEKRSISITEKDIYESLINAAIGQLSKQSNLSKQDRAKIKHFSNLMKDKIKEYFEPEPLEEKKKEQSSPIPTSTSLSDSSEEESDKNLEEKERTITLYNDNLTQDDLYNLAETMMEKLEIYDMTEINKKLSLLSLLTTDNPESSSNKKNVSSYINLKLDPKNTEKMEPLKNNLTEANQKEKREKNKKSLLKTIKILSYYYEPIHTSTRLSKMKSFVMKSANENQSFRENYNNILSSLIKAMPFKNNPMAEKIFQQLVSISEKILSIEFNYYDLDNKGNMGSKKENILKKFVITPLADRIKNFFEDASTYNLDNLIKITGEMDALLKTAAKFIHELPADRFFQAKIREKSTLETYIDEAVNFCQIINRENNVLNDKYKKNQLTQPKATESTLTTQSTPEVVLTTAATTKKM